jgi:hypothetical protein
MAESAPVFESSPPFAQGRSGALAIWVALRIVAALAAPVWVLGFTWNGLHRDIAELLAFVFGLPCLLVFGVASRIVWRSPGFQVVAIVLAIAAIAAQSTATAQQGFSGLVPDLFRGAVLLSLVGLLAEAVSWKLRRSSHA